MLKSQFDFLCKTFGNPDLPDNEKWKCIKYIFIENPIADVQKLIRVNQIMYIDNPNIGPGFYIMSYSNSDLGVPKYSRQVITFIPLKLIDKLSISPFLDDNNDDDNNENNILYVDTYEDTLIIEGLEVETYEDTIIINNAISDTDGDIVIIEPKNKR